MNFNGDKKVQSVPGIASKFSRHLCEFIPTFLLKGVGGTLIMDLACCVSRVFPLVIFVVEETLRTAQPDHCVFLVNTYSAKPSCLVVFKISFFIELRR